MEHYMTAKEAAEYLRTTAPYLANLRHQRRGPIYHQIGRKVLYTVQALDDWVTRSPRRRTRERRGMKAV